MAPVEPQKRCPLLLENIRTTGPKKKKKLAVGQPVGPISIIAPLELQVRTHSIWTCKRQKVQCLSADLLPTYVVRSELFFSRSCLGWQGWVELGKLGKVGVTARAGTIVALRYCYAVGSMSPVACRYISPLIGRFIHRRDTTVHAHLRAFSRHMAPIEDAHARQESVYVCDVVPGRAVLPPAPVARVRQPFERAFPRKPVGSQP